MRAVLLTFLAFVAIASAFLPSSSSVRVRSDVSMKMNDFQKAFAASVLGASLFIGGSARAEINYDGVKYLGGGEIVDLNNANIRAYLKFPGLYPNIASKIITNGPFKAVSDVENIPGLSSVEKDLIKKYESKFVVLDPKPEYVLDKINNGLYR